ncbi:MAG: histidine phosphotransferase [Rhodobacteraceae bacterium]|jgi:histidine phosphotransferase ChpT|nr:histidine phosphotransferase [Paracoccaceae bacterium]MBL4558660.1 histidine phosphotransferase [Paracoccaceae bacterium]HBG98974.1 histidine phosphotransferase [Paracoccaceae bacterium]
MVGDDTTLAALIGSRICHDLISPIGAIGNGLELLSMAGDVQGPEVALMSESVASANARIRFFRIAYGLAPADSLLGRAEVARVIDDTFRGGRLSVVWMPEGDQPRQAVKIAFLCLQCLESAMPHGGEAVVRRDGPGWRIEGDAARLRIEPRLWGPLSNPDTILELTSSDVQFGVLRQIVRDRTPPLLVETGAQRIVMRF